MFDTIFGLPMHALVVHAVVVLLPVAAIGGALVALWPRVRTRFGWLVTLTAVVAAVSVFAAQESGNYLEDKVKATLGPGSAREGALMEAHTKIAENLLPWRSCSLPDWSSCWPSGSSPVAAAAPDGCAPAGTSPPRPSSSGRC